MEMGLLMERTENQQEIIWNYKPMAFRVWWYGILALIVIGTVLWGTGTFSQIAENIFKAFVILWIFTGALSTLPFTIDVNRRKNMIVEGSWWRFLFGRGTMTYRMRK